MGKDRREVFGIVAGVLILAKKLTRSDRVSFWRKAASMPDSRCVELQALADNY
jgi:hypothetical protein